MNYYQPTPRFRNDIDDHRDDNDEEQEIYDRRSHHILQRRQKEILQQRRRRYPLPSAEYEEDEDEDEYEDEDEEPEGMAWRMPRYQIMENRPRWRYPPPYHYGEDYYSSPFDEEVDDDEYDYHYEQDIPRLHRPPPPLSFIPPPWSSVPTPEDAPKPTGAYLARSHSDSRPRFPHRRNSTQPGLRRSNSASSAPTHTDFDPRRRSFRARSTPGSPDLTDEERTDDSDDELVRRPERRRSLHTVPPPPVQDPLRRRRSMLEPPMMMPMPTPAANAVANGALATPGGSSAPTTPWISPHALPPSFHHRSPGTYFGSRPPPFPPMPMPMPTHMMPMPGGMHHPPMPLSIPIGLPWSPGQHPPPPFPPSMMGVPMWDSAAMAGASESVERALPAETTEASSDGPQEPSAAPEMATDTMVTSSSGDLNPVPGFARSTGVASLQRRRSLFGGLFGGGSASRPVHDTFRQDPSTFVPVNAPQDPVFQSGLSRKLSKKAQQFKQLNTVWCYRPRHIPDDGTQRVWVAFSIQNQYKLDRAAFSLRNQNAGRSNQLSVTLDKEEKLSGTVIVMPANGVAYHFPSLFSSSREELEVACFPSQESNLVLRPAASPEERDLPPPNGGSSTGVASRFFGSMFG
ncbi:hypothetical protein DFQ28_004926 [Apophysomyces sp. BC1034]|nr:hypothetical protein DFQ30_005120 [Apophysomyces sp. BC1015]KAG0177969.1 hypothetical protein DFQ29_004126 [Apophysomyces sp. BC1021]KAG0188377.1 hypothetical protein DFQ28_004926 [Apophysomyces sp. BC1034]